MTDRKMAENEKTGICFTDTLTGKIAELRPREDGKVSIYACGPTVYDSPHIGHARTALTYDVIRRYLIWRGYEVHFVMNITDIDDKIINRAGEEGCTTGEIAETYEAVYLEQMDRLGIMRPDALPHATEYVSEMIAVIEELVEREVGYVIEDTGVYFEVAKFGDYGQLVGQDPEVLLEGSGMRVEMDERKRSPQDFALWKAAKPGEPSWDSPWMAGRPGWHIECVAMSLSLLGEGFDIHGGGTDLVFPHHENELAQAEAAGYCFAQRWVHSAMVNVGGEKMAKSVGNFRTVEALLDHWDCDTVRLSMLQAHYRSTMELSDNALGSATEGLARIAAFLRMSEAALTGGDTGGDTDEDKAEAHRFYREAVEEFKAAMDDDFTTPKAVAVVFETVRRGNTAISEGDMVATAAALKAVRELCATLGLWEGKRTAETKGGEGDEVSATELEIQKLVDQRQAARQASDFAVADELRDRLSQEFQVEVEDTPRGPVWRRSV